MFFLRTKINRTPPKTQSALLRHVEKKITVAENQQLTKAIFVFGDPKPNRTRGYIPLPEAQLDRFMFLIRLDYPNRDDELSIAKRTTLGEPPALSKVLTSKSSKRISTTDGKIPVPEHVFERAVDLKEKNKTSVDDAPKWVKDSVQWGAVLEPYNFNSRSKSKGSHSKVTSSPPMMTWML